MSKKTSWSVLASPNSSLLITGFAASINMFLAALNWSWVGRKTALTSAHTVYLDMLIWQLCQPVSRSRLEMKKKANISRWDHPLRSCQMGLEKAREYWDERWNVIQKSAQNPAPKFVFEPTIYFNLFCNTNDFHSISGRGEPSRDEAMNTTLPHCKSNIINKMKKKIHYSKMRR